MKVYTVHMFVCVSVSVETVDTWCLCIHHICVCTHMHARNK